MFPHDSVGCEVGVWMGDFSARLLKVVQPRELHLVDPWKFERAPEYADAWYGGVFAESQADMDRIYEDVLRRFGLPIKEGRIVIHRATSAEAVAAFSDGYLDWVYIDGNHQYEYVGADLDSFAAKVRPGGLVCGDDYGGVGWWNDGVRRAVDDFVQSNRRFEPILLDDQFVLKRLTDARDLST